MIKKREKIVKGVYSRFKVELCSDIGVSLIIKRDIDYGRTTESNSLSFTLTKVGLNNLIKQLTDFENKLKQL